MTGPASVLLLFVAAGLLVLAGVGIGRARGRVPSTRDTALMAAMTGMAVSFLVLVMPVVPIVIFPFVIGGLLIIDWVTHRRWAPLGWFLAGGGAFWAVTQTAGRLNDLADRAVTIPGWTPVPLAIGVAMVVLGVSLVLADRS